MAIIHNLAGQYGKSEAKKRSTRLFMLLTVGGWYVMALLGIGVGIVIATYGVFAALVAMIGFILSLFAAFFFSGQWISREIDKVAKERIKHFRGAQTEAYVAWLLKDELDEAWHVFNNVKLENASDIDHVVVGPNGVFSISTKSARGWFIGQPVGMMMGLLHNHRPCDFAVQAQRQALNLKDRLKVMMGGEVPWVQPVLAVPFGYVDGDALGGQVIVAQAETLTDRIAPDRMSPEWRPAKLDAKQIARVVETMKLISAKAATVYQRPS